MPRIKNFKNLYCIIGASGSGKTSVADIMQNRYGRKILKSYTTRPQRHEGDTDHEYITEEEYSLLDHKIATTEIGGYHYCATQEQVDEADFYVVDWAGFDEMIAKYHGKKKGIYVIYLKCTEDSRKLRMESRGDIAPDIAKRLQIDRQIFDDIAYDRHQNYIIKTIDTTTIDSAVVAGVVRVISERQERKTK